MKKNKIVCPRCQITIDLNKTHTCPGCNRKIYDMRFVKQKDMEDSIILVTNITFLNSNKNYSVTGIVNMDTTLRTSNEEPLYATGGCNNQKLAIIKTKKAYGDITWNYLSINDTLFTIREEE